MAEPVALGVDVGTSGIRIAALDADATTVGSGRAPLPRPDDGGRDPQTWQSALKAAFGALASTCELKTVRAVAVDGTSGTILPVGGDGTPLAHAAMYNDVCDDKAVLE
ncbi:MAG: carbohydrate kinase, partial [Pseudomonadota bacterium]